MKCLYHDDLDGRAAAFCVHAWVGIRDAGTPIEFVPMTYSKNVRDLCIAEGEQVWIVDFSIPTKDMEWLLVLTKDVTWIDHHKSAIEAYAGFPHTIKGMRRDGEAGCVLAWKYIHWYSYRGDTPAVVETADDSEISDGKKELYPVPLPIACTGDRDVWKFERGDETRDFCAAAEAEDTLPESGFWWECITATDHATDESGRRWSNLLAQGRAIRRFCEHRADDLRVKMAWPTEFHGYKALACNAVMGGSEIMGGDKLFAEWPLLIRYEHKAGEFTVSLYSKTIDCADICKQHGGGGHKGAAGFSCAEMLPFTPQK
jgi:hypothetical protein